MTEPLADGAIIELVRAGKTDRFSLLVDRYRPALMKLAISRLGRLDWAEDAVQESFLNAYRSLHSYDSRFSFRTWLWTILLNQCRRQLKRSQRWASASSDWIDPSGESSSLDRFSGDQPEPVEVAMARERLRRIEDLLNELSPPCADAVRLRFFGQLKFQEIADSLGCSISTAKNRVRAGLQHLSERLQSTVDDPSHQTN